MPKVIAIEIVGGGVTGLTVMVIVLLLAIVGAAHVALEMSLQDTTSLFANAADVKVALLVPTFTKFTCH